MLHFLFSSHPLDPDMPDEPFAEQLDVMSQFGFSVSLVSDEVIREAKPIRSVPVDATIVYRGWMLNADEYAKLLSAIDNAGGTPFTTLDEYLAAHHLPNWYPLIVEFTPETRIFQLDAELKSELAKLDWGSFFVKDYVKSLKTSVGSIILDPAQVDRLLEEMKHFRGEIEGGVCVRRVEPFLADTERRYFVINRQPFAPDPSEVIPELVFRCAERIGSKFFSVDVVQRCDGELWIVEVGDGQVSDLVGWSAEAFALAWKESCP